MRNDVKTLITALTTERNSLDRAITALKAMTDAQESVTAPVTTHGGARRQPRGRARQYLSLETWRGIGQRMLLASMSNQRGAMQRVAGECALEYGCRPRTIAQQWRAWAAAAETTLSTANAEAQTRQMMPALVGA